MPTVKCLKCKTEFYVKPSHQLMGWGKYCSITCRREGQLKGKIFPCATCKKNTYKSPLSIKRSKSGKYFCGKVCQTIWRNSVLFTGDNHSNWVNGESVYRKTLIKSDRVQICTLCKTKDKRVLMVHHYDKNRKNNKIDNLIWLCNNCHYLVHHYSNEQEKLTLILEK